MKLKTFIILLLMSIHLVCHAQGLGEWFNQKQTQTKYLIEQIAALQVYLGYLKKGYRITKDGLNLIGNIKNGEFNLHANYFTSLKTVNPNIMKYPKIAAILSMQTDIIHQHYSVMATAKESHQFNTAEIDYIKKVFENLEDESEEDMDELQLVITNGQMQMTDDERIREIDKIYNSVQYKYSFSRSFSDRVKSLAEQRKHGNQGAKELGKLYGIQPQ